ncbi:hypothetical protein LTR53_014150, partial [Teratosphaeriaceae sp. CCFEE 6253]
AEHFGIRSPSRHRQVEPQPSPQRPRFDILQAITGVSDGRTNSVDGPIAGRLHNTADLPARPNAFEMLAPDQHKRPEMKFTDAPWATLHTGPSISGGASSSTGGFRFGMQAPVQARPPFDENRTEPDAGELRMRAFSMSARSEQSSESGQSREKPSLDVRFHNQTQAKHPKTNKAERGGESRRAKTRRKKELEKGNAGAASSAVKPEDAAPPPRNEPFAQAGSPRPWDVPPPQQPSMQPRPQSIMPPPASMPPPAFLPHYLPPRPQGSPTGPPPPPEHEHHHQQQLQQHRNSYPPLPSLAPGWSGPPGPPPPLRSPLFAIPQRPQPPPPPPPSYHPPPPGVDQYLGRPPPPPSLYHQQPQHIPASPLAYGPQYGGPALAPMPDPRYNPPGFRPGAHNHPPAFAQQRGPEGPRKRAQSETHLRSNSWRQYEPNARR